MLLDEEGRLFGVVNIVDLLVVLLLLAVVAAGAALVFGGEGGTETGPETRYATVDFGTHPEGVATEIGEGDSYEPQQGSGNVTITDVHTARSDDGIDVIGRVRLTGESEEDVFQYGGAPLRLTRDVSVKTARYDVSGRIRKVGNASTLDTERTGIVIEDRINPAAAGAITPGQEIRVGNQSTATIESISRYGTMRTNRTRVFVGLSVETVRVDGTPQHGTTRLQENASVALATDEYRLDGRIIAVGTTTDPGDKTTRTVTLHADGVDERIATRLQSGMVEHTSGERTARLTAVTVEPSELVIVADGGVQAVDHPSKRDITVTAELTVRETANSRQFKGKPLRVGDDVRLGFETVSVTPVVDRIE